MTMSKLTCFNCFNQGCPSLDVYFRETRRVLGITSTPRGREEKKPFTTNTNSDFLMGVPLRKKLKDQEAFMNKSNFNALEQDKVGKEPPTEMKTEAKLLDDILSIEEDRATHNRTDLNNMIAPRKKEDKQQKA